MTDHLVEQSESSRAVHLRCLDCDWFAEIGRQGFLDHDTRVEIQPVVEMVKWSHIDPALVSGRTDGEVIEQTTWRRVRQYLVGGQR